MKDWVKAAVKLKFDDNVAWLKMSDALYKATGTRIDNGTIRDRLRHTPQYKKHVNDSEPKADRDIHANILKALNKEQTVDDLCKQFDVSARVCRAVVDDIKDKGVLISDINGKLKVCKTVVPVENKYDEEWHGEKIIRFGVVSDNHLCSKWQQLTFLNHLYDVFKLEGIDTVYNSGDITDGFKMRTGQEFEIFKFGADDQAQYVIDNYPKRENIITKFITGNHDTSHVKNGGIDIGRIIAGQREDMIYLGQLNAKVSITPNCIVELNHPLDGSQYALSYSCQKTIDAMPGGDKPNILLNGHHHKAFYMLYRNIHAFECGTTQAQTSWERGKRIGVNIGGWIIQIYVDDEGTITRCNGEFIPLYKPIEHDYRE